MHLPLCKLIWWPWPLPGRGSVCVCWWLPVIAHKESQIWKSESQILIYIPWILFRLYAGVSPLIEVQSFVDDPFIMWLYLQLGQGTLIQVSPSLIKRRKTHFHHLPCGATIILGNNGYVWICPTETEEMDQTGGYQLSMEVHLYKLIM